MSFRRGPPPPAGPRVAVLAMLLLVAVVLVGLRAVALRRAPLRPTEVVEVVGEVPSPGLHAVDAPATAHAALRAAGLDPAGLPDARLDPGTRLVVEGGAWRAERMDDLLVVGLPLDVNAASAEALEAVPGIGPERAAAIVAERERGGPFASIDDLVRVRGIGSATVDALRPFLEARPPGGGAAGR